MKQTQGFESPALASDAPKAMLAKLKAKAKAGRSAPLSSEPEKTEKDTDAPTRSRKSSTRKEGGSRKSSKRASHDVLAPRPTSMRLPSHVRDRLTTGVNALAAHKTELEYQRRERLGVPTDRTAVMTLAVELFMQLDTAKQFQLLENGLDDESILSN